MIISPAQLLQSLNRNDPEAITVTTGVNWLSYEKLLKILEDSNAYRISYLDGTLVILSPSRAHEVIKI